MEFVLVELSTSFYDGGVSPTTYFDPSLSDRFPKASQQGMPHDRYTTTILKALGDKGDGPYGYDDDWTTSPMKKNDLDVSRALKITSDVCASIGFVEEGEFIMLVLVDDVMGRMWSPRETPSFARTLLSFFLQTVLPSL